MTNMPAGDATIADMATGKMLPGLLAMMAFLVAVFCATQPATAQNALSRGWTLQPEASTLNFQSVKNNSKVESSTFATYSGAIDEDGTATINILLDSVDTQIDLRNVRMRFLFFETFQYPQAVVTTRIDPSILDDLARVRRKIIALPYTLTLHGVTQELVADVSITLISNDLVAIATSAPISLSTSLFDLDGGVAKLEEAAGVDIVPSASVTFDLVFARNPETGRPVAAAPAEDLTPVRAAVEPQGNFDLEACKGRFEILSRTDNINFRSGSATLDDQSSYLLDSISDIVRRCPGLRIVVAGHTDSDGSDATNQWLSEQRAASVVRYLEAQGVASAEIASVGYGESRPLVPNDTAQNKRRNRRIEFAVADE